MLMNKRIILVIIIALVLAGGYVLLNNWNAALKTNNVNQSTQPTQAMIKDGDDSKVVIGEFEGTIPCADCERIKMKLTLYQDPKTLGAAGYTLDQVYVGKGDERFSEQGEWDYLRGNSKDANATIYGLNLDKPKEDQMYFLKVGDDAVTMLDRNMDPIMSDLNYTLMKN